MSSNLSLVPPSDSLFHVIANALVQPLPPLDAALLSQEKADCLKKSRVLMKKHIYRMMVTCCCLVRLVKQALGRELDGRLRVMTESTRLQEMWSLVRGAHLMSGHR